MKLNEEIDLLGEYAVFLEEILNNEDRKLSDMSIMEVVDENFNAAADYFSRDGMPRLSVVTKNIFDNQVGVLPITMTPYFPLYPEAPYKHEDNFEDIKRLFNIFDLDLIYAQMPIKDHEDVIRKLSMVASNSGITAVFGTYYYNDDEVSRHYNDALMNGFKNCLQSRDLDFNQYIKETSDKHFEVIMSKK
ncbi:MAG: hypothetical protein IKJ43_03290 [Bacilli bacterium]|nr:hypothetical protein [Bacilli bacterium]